MNRNVKDESEYKPGQMISSGEIIEARQALFFIGVVILLASIYPLYRLGFSIGVVLSLSLSVGALFLAVWSKTNPVRAFKVGLIASMIFVFANLLILNFLGCLVVGIFSLAFYRGWKYAKIQFKSEEEEDNSRPDILDDGFF